MLQVHSEQLYTVLQVHYKQLCYTYIQNNWKIETFSADLSGCQLEDCADCTVILIALRKNKWKYLLQILSQLFYVNIFIASPLLMVKNTV